MPKLSQEQIDQAREVDLLAYLLSNESGVLKQEGANYRHNEHDSLVYVASKNYWYAGHGRHADGNGRKPRRDR